jgi:TetR/AcrR family fatty acid metabolism transcriptional regulator
MNMEKTLSRKEEQILRAAEQVFAQRGFFRAKIDEIADKAKVAKGTVYLYFPDKITLFISLLQKRLKEAIEKIDEIAREDNSNEEKLSKIFDYLVSNRFSNSHKAFFSQSYQEPIIFSAELMREFKKRLEPEIRNIMSQITMIIKEGMRTKEFIKADPQLVTILFLNTIKSVPILKFYQENYRLSLKSLKELLFKVIKRSERCVQDRCY